jgi:purine catabolism regulator
MSTPTVASLSATLGAHLAPYPGFEAPAVPIAAVHISELLDPTAYLSGGELLLTTGLSVPTSRIGCDAYVTRLVRVGVVALCIGLGPVYAEPPAELVASCRRLGLPLLVVPGPTPFLTISKAYWQAVARSSERVLTDALAVQQAMVDAAASPDPVPAVLRRLATAVDGWAAVLGPHGTVAHVHPQHQLTDVAALEREVGRLAGTGIRSASSFATAEHNVGVYPMTVGATAVGYLAVGAATKPDAGMRRTILVAAALLSLVLSYAERLRASDDAAHAAAGESVAALLELGHAAAARDLAESLGRPPVPARARVLVVRAPDRAAVEAALATFGDRCGRWVDAATAWFLLPAKVSEQRLVDRLRRADPEAAGVTTTATPIDDVAAVVARAVGAATTLRAGQWLTPTQREDPDLVAAGLERLLAHAAPETLAALASYLRHRGRWEAAARELDVHRNTLRYRIGRAVDLLGTDIDDPDVAARLWLELRARLLA